MKRLLALLPLYFIICSSFAQINNQTVVTDNQTFQLLQNLSKSKLGKGSIYLFTTTHEDIAWLDQPEACIINRDTLWLTPYFDRLEKEPDFKMDIEQSSIIMEYIHRHPEKKEMINKYLKEGRICVGATYVQAYEELYSGESLVRQFYLGTRWMKQHFDGYTTSSYFNVDVPGRTPQMPQIMKKAGVNNLVLSRQSKGLFNWEAPDESFVRAYSPGHYMYFYNVLAKNDTAAIAELAREAVLWYTKYNNSPKFQAVMPAMLNYEFLWDQAPVKNCIPFITKWNNIKQIQSPEGKKTTVNLPQFKYATADDFFAAIDKSTPDISTVHGERPNVWLYIHGPSHEQAITKSRKGDIMLPVAEKIASFNALTNESFVHYPEEQLHMAWKNKIYPDHGWGGKNGIITDQTFLEKFESALSDANSITEQENSSLASNVQVNGKKGIPIVVINSLSWKRSDVVTVPIQLKKGYASHLSLQCTNGQSIPCQLSNIRNYDDGSICSADLHFVAPDVPSLGLETLYLNPSNSKTATGKDTNISQIKNSFYTIDLVNGGISQITDNELNVKLIDAAKFLGGEIITMQSIGNGAGEFDAVQQPTMENFDKVSNHQPTWQLKENGDVYTSFFYRSNIRNAVVEQTLKVYHQIKKIDINVAILNWEGILYREYRMMIPTPIAGGEVSYEVPFSVVTVGKDEMPGAAGERYNVENKDQHPRGIGNWIGVSGHDFGITLSSSVAVADYIDPTDHPVTNTILQPILFASRKSCHSEGNEYLQYGDHFFSFSLTSHRPGWENGSCFGQAANEKLMAVFAPKVYKDASLPETFSFFNLENPNVIVSSIKKCEDDNSLIIRLYNIGNKPEQVTLNALLAPKEIFKVNLIEEKPEKVNKITLGKHAIETYKLVYDRMN